MSSVETTPMPATAITRWRVVRVSASARTRLIGQSR